MVGGVIQQGQAFRNGQSVCVIIAAFNAERTIARAVRSALAQLEVSEVIVVDDASTDGTVAATSACDDGSGRLKLLRQPKNLGPAAARNRAISESEAPYVAVLDADDMFLPGRFEALLVATEWDVVADNIVFVLEERFDGRLPTIASGTGSRALLPLPAFVNGNISKPDRPRGELGFIKPVIKRCFIVKHQLQYDESLRLGEDYVFYVQMLAVGARFLVIDHCGYLALQRASSLSGNHRMSDIAALLAADEQLLSLPDLSVESRSALRRHVRHVSRKHHHRYILDVRRKKGRLAAALAAGLKPKRLLPLAADVLRDKLGRSSINQTQKEVRYLLD